MLKKGSLIGVEGRIQTRNYEANGVTRYITEVLCDNVQFLDTKKDSERSQQNDDEVQDDDFANKVNGVDDNDLPY